MMMMPEIAHRSAFGKIVLNEFRLALRSPAAVIAGVALPVVLLVIFGELPSFHKHTPAFGGLTPFVVYLPILAVLGLAVLALYGLPGPLVTYREQGILRRLSTTPVPPSWLLAAQVVVQLGVELISLLVVLVAGTTAFGAPAPPSPAGLVLSCALSIAGMFALGLLIAAVARTSTAFNVISRLAFFPLLFFAGLWLPRQAMPGTLRGISSFTPLGAAVQAIQYSMQTAFPPTLPLLVLLGYAVLFGYLARRLFTWE